jgi:hypothetical protein
MSNKCPTQNCDTPIPAGSKMLYCKNCRQVMGNWAKRKRAEITERANSLLKWGDRMSNLKQRKERKGE